jgi:hypothetical protein
LIDNIQRELYFQVVFVDIRYDCTEDIDKLTNKLLTAVIREAIVLFPPLISNHRLNQIEIHWIQRFTTDPAPNKDTSENSTRCPIISCPIS